MRRNRARFAAKPREACTPIVEVQHVDRYNPAVLMARLQNIFSWVFVSLFIVACSPNKPEATATGGPTAVVIPFQTLTPVQIPSLSVDIDLNQPTSTPATYTVVSGDTFFSIAAQLNISLDALMAANPGVDPRLLTPETTLILPTANGTEVVSIPTPTPVSVTVGETKCYASAAGELWCFIQIENTLDLSVENLTAVVQLLAQDGSVLANLEAFPPINLLEAGNSMPLVAYTADPPKGWTVAHGQLLGAYSLSAGTDYYLVANIQDANIAISQDSLSANVTGRVEIQDGESGTIWVLALAYDAAGEIVGFRRWESEGATEFDTFVYSLGPEISTVDLLVEARR